MARFDRLASEPQTVRFAGFESDTYTLQRNGWQLSADENVLEGRLRLALRHAATGLYMMAEDQRYDFMRLSDVHRGHQATFEVRHCSSKMAIELIRNSNYFDSFRPIDAEPQYVTRESKSIEDFKIFASPLVRTEQIIIEPQSVAECLDLIRKMQAPELAAVRQRNEQREYGDAVNQQKFHAQIMSLAA